MYFNFNIIVYCAGEVCCTGKG